MALSFTRGLGGSPWIRARTHDSKYPPAEPEALRLLAPQRGLIAIVERQIMPIQYLCGTSRFRQRASLPFGGSLFQTVHTPGTVKLLLPPRQSRGNSRLD